MNSSNVSGVEKDFEKWWDKSLYESYDNAKIVAKDVWSIKQARINRLEEALKTVEFKLQTMAANRKLMQVAQPARELLNIIKPALTPESQEGK